MWYSPDVSNVATMRDQVTRDLERFRSKYQRCEGHAFKLVGVSTCKEETTGSCSVSKVTRVTEGSLRRKAMSLRRLQA